MNISNDENYKITVEELYAGLRLDRFLTDSIGSFSRSKVQQMIESGVVTKNGVIISDCSHKVIAGESYDVSPPKPVEYKADAVKMDLTIVYEDNDVIVINKQAGLTVHPGAGCHTDTLVNGLLYRYKDKLSTLGGLFRPGIVHRLDKDTSGLMIVAKNDESHAFLAGQIEQRKVARKYLAFCWGVPPMTPGRIEGNIGRSRLDRKKMAVLKTGGKFAATNYTVKESFIDRAVSLVECKLETGRTHQIRVHMTHIRHPLVGDQSYGLQRRKVVSKFSDNLKEFLKRFRRQALHSYYLSFVHPKTLQEMEFEIDLPDDLRMLKKLLREG